MCEFKIINQTDNTQLGEEIVVAHYSQNNQLLLKDILGTAITLESALILEVNTLNQTLTVVEHPLVKNFVEILKTLVENKENSEKINEFQKALDQVKK